MYIFIDEAGGFQIPARPNLVSCVAALLVPESISMTLFRRIRRLIRPWRSGGREVKGSQLTEEQMAQVIRTVRRFEVLLISVAIDMGLHSDAGITLHKKAQVENLLAGISAAHSQAMQAKIESLATRMGDLPNQLYVQAVVLIQLVQVVLEVGTLYYVERIPRTLGSFIWRPDAKDVRVTSYERLWREIAGPFLQTISLSSPHPRMIGADYSAFERFCGTLPEAPEHLRGQIARPNRPLSYVDIDLLLADLKFSASHRLTGIQIVDMLGAAIRRACNGTLQASGWKGIGRLMPTAQRGGDCVRFVTLGDVKYDRLPYSPIVKGWNRETRRLILEERGPTSR